MPCSKPLVETYLRFLSCRRQRHQKNFTQPLILQLFSMLLIPDLGIVHFRATVISLFTRPSNYPFRSALLLLFLSHVCHIMLRVLSDCFSSCCTNEKTEMPGVEDLGKLVQRLETATARLEALAAQKPQLAPKPAHLSSGGAPSGGSDSEPPAHVKAYDAAIEAPLSRFNSISNQIGGEVAEMAKKFSGAMELQRHFLWQAASQTKASADTLQKMMQPLLDAANDIAAFKEAGRRSPYFNHLNSVSEAISALGWVTIEKTPAPFIKEGLEAAMFYLNRIRMEYKEKDKKHIDWVVSFQEIMTELQTFVKQTHTTGLVWNSAPGNAPAGAPKSSAPTAGPSKGGAPPPPPPPPAGLFDDIPKAAAPTSDKAGRDALFAQLNQGADITKGLKKVTADMQTHKNPNLRTTSTVPSGSATSVGSAGSASPAKAPVQKPPRLELENHKQWTVEYHNGNRNIVVEITEKKQSVYIFKCDNCTIQVKGKCNSVALDQCKKTAVVVEGVVAQIETINCQSLQIQTMGEMPTLSIQKTDGCQVYLSQASKDCEIVTSKSSEMNVLVPEGPDGEFIELPLPEQFKTVYKGGKLVTTVSDIC